MVKKFEKLLLAIFTGLVFLILLPSMAFGSLQVTNDANGIELTRSLESLRDLDYQTWQVAVYPEVSSNQKIILRIVGYPGTLRFDHPTSLKVHSGRRDWFLKDITLENPKLANDPREAAAEFNLSPLLNDLSNNRPLRLMLKGVFSDLPVPPYLVSEWREIFAKKVINESK